MKFKADIQFTVFNLPITADRYLPIILLCMIWFLGQRYFPEMVNLDDKRDYWILGFLGSFSLLLSIIIHELGHALAANVLHIPIERIHVYLFGGMAELRHRPFLATQEFFVSLAGPIASAVLSLSSFSLVQLFDATDFPISYLSIHFLAYINLFLTIFNLIPIFPLDGGRAVRALIWKQKHNFYKASVLMHRLSSVLIASFFVISLALFFAYQGRFSFWFGIFSLYTAYLLMKAKKELTHVPHFEQLIFKLDAELSPAQLVEKLIDINPESIKKAILPVFVEKQLSGFIKGQDIFKLVDGDISLKELLRTPETGLYIEIAQTETYSNDVTYEGEYIPVFKQGMYYGLCDAYEMRFWLQQQ